MSDHKANLFVVGAMRSGTTAFMDILAGHPEIHTSPIKEPHHFVGTLPSEIFEPQPKFNVKAYLANEFPKKTHRAHITEVENYQALFSMCTNEKYRAEGSVSYLHAPNVAPKIVDFQASSKIIILLRDPLQRLISHYRMDVGLLREKRTLNEVVENQISLYHKGILPWYSHLGMSLYKNAVEQYIHVFGENVLILNSETFFSNPEFAMRKVSSFLEIDEFKNTLATRKNESRSHRFPKLFTYLKDSEVLNRLKWGMPSSIKRRLWQALSSSEIPSSMLSESNTKQLIAIFKKESNLKTLY